MIWDFEKACENCNDHEWGANPLDPEPPKPGPSTATTTYWGKDGKPLSAQELMKRLFDRLTCLITNEDHLCKV